MHRQEESDVLTFKLVPCSKNQNTHFLWPLIYSTRDTLLLPIFCPALYLILHLQSLIVIVTSSDALALKQHHDIPIGTSAASRDPFYYQRSSSPSGKFKVIFSSEEEENNRPIKNLNKGSHSILNPSTA